MADFPLGSSTPDSSVDHEARQPADLLAPYLLPALCVLVAGLSLYALVATLLTQTQTQVPAEKAAGALALIGAIVICLATIFRRAESHATSLVPAIRYTSSLVTAIAAIFTLLILAGLLLAAPGAEPVISIVALGGCIIWSLAYWLLMIRSDEKADAAQTAMDAANASASVNLRAGAEPLSRPADAATGSGQAVMPATTDDSQNRLLRYGVGTIALLLGTLGIALILTRHDLLDDFIFIFPPLALFPFSWIAYTAYQRDVRIERLRRDFFLLQAPWDTKLVRQAQGLSNFALHIVLAMLMTVIGLTIFFGRLDNSPIRLDAETLTAMRFGFIGSLLFSGQLIYRRYTTYDLHPSVYLYCALTILGGLIFNFVAFQAISIMPTESAIADDAVRSAAITAAADAQAAGTDVVAAVRQATTQASEAVAVATTNGLGDGLVGIIAFALGFFPLLAVQWLSRTAYTALRVARSRSDEMPLSLIEGISQFHETRLRDLGIDDIQNLASVNIPFLLINTTFSAQQVIDWVDQAILCVHLEPNEIAIFRHGRIRTISDFRDAISGCEADTAKWDDLATALQSTKDQLIALSRATAHGPNLQYIFNYWRNADIQLTELHNARLNQVLVEAYYAARTEDSERLKSLREQATDYLDDFQHQAKLHQIEKLDAIIGSGAAWAGLACLYQSQDGATPQDSTLLPDLQIDGYQTAWAQNLDTNDFALREREAQLLKRLDAGDNSTLADVIRWYQTVWNQNVDLNNRVLESIHNLTDRQLATDEAPALDNVILWYKDALLNSVAVKQQVIDRLKKLTDCKIEQAKREEAIADNTDANGAGGKQQHLMAALALIDEAVELSRQFYDDGSAKSAILRLKADLEDKLGRPEAAADTRALAQREALEREAAAVVLQRLLTQFNEICAAPDNANGNIEEPRIAPTGP